MIEEVNTARGRGRLGFVLAGLGLGGILAYLIQRQRRIRNRGLIDKESRALSDNVVDDRGTSQNQAAKMLRNLRDRGFEANDERVAVALGRTAEEFQAFSSGRETIDDDVIMKARGLAMHRNIRIE